MGVPPVLTEPYTDSSSGFSVAAEHIDDLVLDKLLIISCIDNLLKGASGQAVHNMNLMFNLEETVGLRLKPSAF